MSDEERIEQLELEVKVLRANNKWLKDKIDEQSKEIEELKKPKYLYNANTGEITRLDNISDYISKDKIKAKIEEIDMTGEIGYLVKGILQSLLEKE